MSKRPVRNYLKIINEFANTQSPFDFEILGSIHYDKCYPFISFHTHSKLAKYNVVINSGAHGEESIAVRVMLRFLQEFNKEFLGYYNFQLFPIINPFGYTYNKRKNGNNQYGNTGFNLAKLENVTQEALLIKEAIPNKVDLFIDIHADITKSGFYIYERKRPDNGSLAETSLAILKKNKIPILENDTVYLEKCVKGVVVQPIKDGSMDDSMFQKGAIYSLCIEIPGKIPEDNQMIGGLILLNQILAKFKEIK
jgi:predicted deacylase